jgi:hypothetical protein
VTRIESRRDGPARVCTGWANHSGQALHRGHNSNDRRCSESPRNFYRVDGQREPAEWRALFGTVERVRTTNAAFPGEFVAETGVGLVGLAASGIVGVR